MRNKKTQIEEVKNWKKKNFPWRFQETNRKNCRLNYTGIVWQKTLEKKNEITYLQPRTRVLDLYKSQIRSKILLPHLGCSFSVLGKDQNCLYSLVGVELSFTLQHLSCRQNIKLIIISMGNVQMSSSPDLYDKDTSFYLHRVKQSFLCNLNVKNVPLKWLLFFLPWNYHFMEQNLVWTILEFYNLNLFKSRVYHYLSSLSS